MQHWTVDVEKKTVNMQVGGYRQISPIQAPLDVKPIADEIVQCILNRENDGRLKWSKPGHVQVLISRIVPEWSASKETLKGRRGRLSSAILQLLRSEGWKDMGRSWYKPPDVAFHK